MNDKTDPASGSNKTNTKNSNETDDFHDHLDAFSHQEELLFGAEDNAPGDAAFDEPDHLVADHLQQDNPQSDNKRYANEENFDSELSHLDPFMDNEMEAFESDAAVIDEAEEGSYSRLITQALAATALIIVVVVWFVWPSGPVHPPEYAAQTESVSDKINPPVQQALGESEEVVVIPEPEVVETTKMLMVEPKVEEVTKEVAAAEVAEPETVIPEVSSPKTMRISVNLGNVRIEPVAGTQIVARLTRDTPVLVLSRSGDWYEIQLGADQRGWAHETVLAAEPATPAKNGSEATPLVVSVDVGNIRRDPHPKSQILYKLKQGSAVTRIHIEGEWYKVRLDNGVVAWAHQSIF